MPSCQNQDFLCIFIFQLIIVLDNSTSHFLELAMLIAVGTLFQIRMEVGSITTHGTHESSICLYDNIHILCSFYFQYFFR